jgi:hypothetical protein
MRLGYAQANGIEPRGHSRFATKGDEALMNDDEHLLERIVEIPVADAEALQARPHELGVIAVDLFDRWGGRRRGFAVEPFLEELPNAHRQEITVSE